MRRRDFLRTATGAAAAATLAATLPLDGADAAATAERPNLLFILADDLGYADLGCYGQRDLPTPNIDLLAREGTRFTSVYAGSTVCAPSRCCLLTGLHTGHATVRGNGDTTLPPEEVTLAKVLKAAGYETACIGKWGLGNEGTTGVPTKQGFDTFFGYLDHVHAHNHFPEHLWRGEEKLPLKNQVPDAGNRGQGKASVKAEYSNDLFTEEALKFLDAPREKPFFLYLSYTLPHANNEARQEGMEVPNDEIFAVFKDKAWPEPQKGFAAMIARLDQYVGRIAGKLREKGLDRNTLVIFTSDNGPHREGGNNPNFFDSNGSFRGIKRDLYEGGIRVPFIAWWPGRVPAGKASDHIGYFPDLLPTFAELAGAPPPKHRDGISMAPALLERGGQKQHTYLYWEFYERGGAQAVRIGKKWKAVRAGIAESKNPVEVYDLELDISEARDVASSRPEIAAYARSLMAEAHVPSPRWQVAAPRPAAGTS
jgi:Arylsulfatase A and related enzymes